MATALDEALSDLLYEGALELVVPRGHQRRRQPEAVTTPPASQLPIISIGRPRAWTIEQLVSSQNPPAQVKASLEQEMFFVIRLACSFRPQHDNVRVAWAQLAMYLRPDEKGCTPLAFDLYPKSVERERKASKRVSLSPSLKFHDVDTELEEFAYIVDYPAIEPMVTATGIDGSTPSWNFTAVPGFPVRGARLLHSVVAAPRTFGSLTVAMMITADLDYEKQRFSAWLPNHHNEAHPWILDVRLWP
jgi:hypothetical protein